MTLLTQTAHSGFTRILLTVYTCRPQAYRDVSGLRQTVAHHIIKHSILLQIFMFVFFEIYNGWQKRQMLSPVHGHAG